MGNRRSWYCHIPTTLQKSKQNNWQLHFYTDNWDSFAKVLPQDRHVIGKSHTSAIERDNSNTRHNIARFTRKTKVVSHKKEMVDKSIKLWLSFQNHVVFDKYKEMLLSIFWWKLSYFLSNATNTFCLFIAILPLHSIEFVICLLMIVQIDFVINYLQLHLKYYTLYYFLTSYIYNKLVEEHLLFPYIIYFFFIII